MKIAAEPVWIVDDDESIRWVLAQALKSENILSKSFCSAEQALESFTKEQPKVFVTDIRMKGMDGLTFLDQIQRLNASLPVIVMTAYSDLDSTVESYQRGACEHLPKPFDIDDAVNLIQRVMDESDVAPKKIPAKRVSTPTMIGDSPPMQEVFRAIGRLSKSELNVLITGESGTGKELVARALFENSVRRHQPFVAINAAAIPADLLESELFGHEKGAFTGANQRRIGRFEQADRGTLFLDEIGDMPHDLQSRLLRVLSEGKFYRVGGTRQITVDVRIIAATNQDLEEQVKQKIFRADLFHRLNVVRISLAPVRDRGNDIPLLIKHYMKQAVQELGVEKKQITTLAMQLLTHYDWPGNVREIKSVCRSMAIMSPTHAITIQDVPPGIKSAQRETDEHTSHTGWESDLRTGFRKMVVEQAMKDDLNIRKTVERVLLESVLEITDGSRHRAAEILDWHRNTVTLKISEIKKDSI